MLNNLLKGKKLGFYFMVADAALALIFGIIFMATYGTSMANNASAHVPEVIGICAFLCFILEVVALFVPEHKWVHLGALLAICFSLMKEIYLIPNLIADYFNNVAFQGGSLPMNIFYLVMLFIIVGLSVAASFLEYGETEAKVSFSKPNIIRYSVSGGVALVASIVSIVVVSVLSSGVVAPGPDDGTGEEKPDPIAEQFKDQVIEYDFDPLGVKFSEATNPYATAEKSEIQNTVGAMNSSNPTVREGFNLVYQFNGFYAEGYQGDYSKTYGYLYLWDDGLYNGKIENKNIYGYWYNQEDNGDDCLVLVDNRGSEADMVCKKLNSKFYDWGADIRIDFSWGQRTCPANGFYYYPEIGMYIDTGDDTLTYEVGAEIDTTNWTAMQVRNDLRYGPIFDPDRNVRWTFPSTAEAGEQVVKATWGEFSAEVKITVVESTAE